MMAQSASATGGYAAGRIGASVSSMPSADAQSGGVPTVASIGRGRKRRKGGRTTSARGGESVLALP